MPDIGTTPKAFRLVVIPLIKLYTWFACKMEAKPPAEQPESMT